MRVTTLEEEVAATSSLEVGLEAGSGSTRDILDLTLPIKDPVRGHSTKGKQDNTTATAASHTACCVLKQESVTKTIPHLESKLCKTLSKRRNKLTSLVYFDPVRHTELGKKTRLCISINRKWKSTLLVYFSTVRRRKSE